MSPPWAGIWGWGSPNRQPVLSMMVLFYVLKESVVSFLVEVRRDDSLVLSHTSAQGVSSSALKHIRKKWELVWCELKKASCSRSARSRAPVGCSMLEYLVEKSTILPPYTWLHSWGNLTTRTLGWHALVDTLRCAALHFAFRLAHSVVSYHWPARWLSVPVSPQWLLLILLRHHLKITLPFGVLAAGTAELNVYFFPRCRVTWLHVTW